jgi:hypothetical protein
MTGRLVLVNLVESHALTPAQRCRLTHLVVGTSTDASSVLSRLTTPDTNGADAIFSDFAYAYNGSAYGDHALPPEPLKFFVEDGKASGDGVFTEDWSLSRYVGRVGMTFTVTWHDGADRYTTNVSAQVDAPSGCDWPPPPATRPSTPASGTPTPALTGNTAGSGGSLPITGAAAGTIAGVAALLLAAGVILFVVSRKAKFTP